MGFRVVSDRVRVEGLAVVRALRRSMSMLSTHSATCR